MEPPDLEPPDSGHPDLRPPDLVPPDFGLPEAGILPWAQTCPDSAASGSRNFFDFRSMLMVSRLVTLLTTSYMERDLAS